MLNSIQVYKDGEVVTVKEGVVLAIKLLSFATLLLSLAMTVPIALNLDELFFNFDMDIPLSLLMIGILDIFFYMGGIIPLDRDVYKLISDPEQFYKALLFTALMTYNIFTLFPSFVLMGMVGNYTEQCFKNTMEKSILQIEDLQNVIEIWSTTCSALGAPMLIMFTSQQIVSVLTIYASLGDCFSL